MARAASSTAPTRRRISAMPQRSPRSRRDCRKMPFRFAARRGGRSRPRWRSGSIRSDRPCFANRISAPGPDGGTTISSPSSATPTAISGNRRRATPRPAAKASSTRSARTVDGLASLPAGDVVLVAHSGTVRAALAIALELEPDAALRFVIDPLSLTRIDRLERGWRVVAVNSRVENHRPEATRSSTISRMRDAKGAYAYPFLRSPRSVGRPMPAASKPPSTARICPVM